MSEYMVYIGCVVAIAAGAAAMVWLRREGDANWRRHRSAVVSLRITLDASKFVAAMAGVSVAMAPALKAAADMERAMSQFAAAMTTTPAPTPAHPSEEADRG